MAASMAGGYDEDFVDAPDEDYKCPVCLLVAKDPLLTRCGHLFCRTCYEILLEKDERDQTFQCPVDRQMLKKEDVFPDARTERRILQLKVKCRVSNAGCTAIFELREAERHLEICGYVEVCCPNECGNTMQRSEVDGHLKNSCSQRSVDCEYCSAIVTFIELQNHLENECQLIPIDCPQCDLRMPRHLLSAHCSADSTGDCPYTDISCSFCIAKYSRMYMDVHMQDSVAAHMQLLLQNSRKQQQQHLEEMRAIERKHKLALAEKDRERDKLLKKIVSLEQRFDEQRESVSVDLDTVFDFLFKFTWKIERLNYGQMECLTLKSADFFHSRSPYALNLQLEQRSDSSTILALVSKNSSHALRNGIDYTVFVRGIRKTVKRRATYNRVGNRRTIDLVAFQIAGASGYSGELPVILLGRIPSPLIIHFTYDVVNYTE